MFTRDPNDNRAIDTTELQHDDAVKAYGQLALSSASLAALNMARPRAADDLADMLVALLATPTESELGLRQRGT